MRVVGRSLRAPRVVLFILALAAYSYFYQGGGWNQNSRFDLTRAIVQQHTLSIDVFHANTGDESLHDGHYYCDKAPGVSLLAVPVWAVVYYTIGAPEVPSQRALAIGAWLSTAIVIGVPSAFAVSALFGLLMHLGLSTRRASLTAAAWGLATLAWPYATLMYGHQLAAALLLLAFAQVASVAPGTASLRRLATVGFLVSVAVGVEYPAALAGIVIAVYALRTARWQYVVAGIALGGFLPALILGWYHTAAFGGPTVLPYSFSTQASRHLGWFMGLGVPDPTALWSILGSSYRGLFYTAPQLLLAFPGAVLWWRRGEPALVAACSAIAILFLWLNASLVDWQGGWAMGPRYLVPMLPFAVVLAAGTLLPTQRPASSDSRASWVSVAAITVLSATAMLIGTAVKPEVPSGYRQPFQQYLLPHFATGDLSISTQGIDMRVPQADNQAPHQAWNLGEAIGLRGWASLLPLLAMFALCAWRLSRVETGLDRTNRQAVKQTPA